MQARNQYKAPIVTACVCLALSAVMLWPNLHGHRASPYMPALFFTPAGTGFLAGAMVWRFIDVTPIAVSTGVLVALIGWYFPIGLFMLANPPLCKRDRMIYILGTFLCWGIPIVVFSVYVLTA